VKQVGDNQNDDFEKLVEYLDKSKKSFKTEEEAF